MLARRSRTIYYWFMLHAPSSEPPDPFADYLCFSLYAANLAVGRRYKPLLDPLGLTYPQYLVLVALRETGPQPVGGLGERLCLETNTLTPLLKRMEAAGLVTRRRNPDDERVVLVALSGKGMALAESTREIPARLLDGNAADVPRLAALNAELKALRAAL
jgi:DNA-binding MarR family transcriptional regulator